MKQRRLAVLLAVLVVLLGLRWWDPPMGTASTEVSEAVVKPAAHASSELAGNVPVDSVGAVAGPPDGPPRVSVFAATRDLDTSEPRNAFGVRTPTPPPAPAPSPVRAAAVAAVQAAPVVPPPPPPPPPLQVIGGWRDERGVSVFVAGPRSVLQGRVGDVLLSEYRITQITPQQVLLRHLPSNRDIPLAVPAVAGPSLTASK